MPTGLATDVAHAFRFLGRRPWFAAGIVLTLTVGLGANAVIFAAVRALVLGPLPFADPTRLAVIEGLSRPDGESARTSWPDYVDLAGQSRRLRPVGALQIDTFTVRADREAERLRGARVTASLFRTLQFGVAEGRVLLPDDDRPGAAPVALLGHGFWQRRFGGVDVIGRTVVIDGTPHVVVGVLPRGVDFPAGFSDVWLPLGPVGSTDRARRNVVVIGRIDGGASLAAAQAELAGIAARLETAWPGTNRGWSMRPVPLQDFLRRGPRRVLTVLWGAVAAVLLIACANIASMMLARAVERRAEVAVRIALGATRAQLVRRLLVESLIPSVAGGVAGLFVARWGIGPVRAALGGAMVPPDAIGIDGGVLAFGLAASVVTGLAFGIAPALHLARSDARGALQDGGRPGTPGRDTVRLQSVLTFAEIAAAVTLLLSAGVLIGAFERLQAVNLGFRPDHVLTAEVSARSVAGSDEGRAAFFQTLLEEVAAQPGVVAAAAVNWPPMTSETVRRYDVRTRGDGQPITAGYRVATPAYARALGLRVSHGRYLEASDTMATLPVAVVNQTLAERAWPGGSALGRHIAEHPADGTFPTWLTVVGVVEDVRHLGPGRQPEPEVFVALSQHPAESLYLVVRTVGEPGAFAPVLAAVVRRINPDVPLSLVRPMTQVLADFLAMGRAITGLVAAFAALALLLSATGLFGVIGCVVGQRTREFGIRLALGASRMALLGLVLRQSLALAFSGLIAGTAGGLAIARLLRTFVLDDIRSEPSVFVAVTVAVVSVALAASVLPLRRLLRRDPLLALREG